MLIKIFQEVYEISKISFSTMGVIWTVVNILEFYFPKHLLVIKYKDDIRILLFPALITTVISLFNLIKSRYVIKYKIDDIRIIIMVHDIFRIRNGVNVIGINNQLCTQVDKIGENSIHSKMIDKYGKEVMRDVFVKGKEKIRNGKKYFQDKIKNKDFLFLPMSNVDDGAASTTITIVNDALKNIFENQEYLRLPNGKINIPIIGTGAAGINLSKEDVIKLIIENYLDFKNKSGEEDNSKIKVLNIIVYWKDILNIDWLELNRWMKNQVDYCQKCKIDNWKS